jgi:CelD/BcsL family acetyltransferase involved in cellulose biosynthesis
VTVFTLSPLREPRWSELVARHRRASVFHTTGWLEALQRTYGYEPRALTTSPPGADLQNAIPFCEVRSWATGRRLVSLPFSDHCDPLVDDPEELAVLCTRFRAEQRDGGWGYIELRPGQHSQVPAGFSESASFVSHVLDLRPGPEALFGAFHKDSVQRKIRRAEREGLTCEQGRTEDLLRKFYALLVTTRRRHHLPPQPFNWFRNLAACCKESFRVRIASVGRRPVAGIMTLQHRDTLVYKYGASDAGYHPVGSMQFLFWRTIVDACAAGCLSFDLGRSDPEQSGLVRFKERLGAAPASLTYWRCPESRAKSGPLQKWLARCAGQAFVHAPDGVRVAAGTLLYKHIG